MLIKEYIWSCDPIGSFFFITSATLMLLGLDWAGGAYQWHDIHVAVPLGIGCGFLVLFCLYGEILFISYGWVVADKTLHFRMERTF
jgi:hypothetical protein